MFELVALGSDVDVLRAGLFELRRRKVHVLTGSDAALKAALRQLKSFLKGVDIAIKKLLLRVESSQSQEIQSKFRVQAEAERFQVRGRSLRQFAAGLNGMPDASQTSAS